MTAPPIADQLVQRASQLVKQGKLPEAADLLDQASRLHRSAHRRTDEARCLVLVARLRRAFGDIQWADAAVTRALRISQPDPPLWVEASNEFAEVLAAREDISGAVAQLDKSLAALSDAPDRAVETAVRRRRASLLAQLGDAAGAADELGTVTELLAEDGQGGEARRALVERATALHSGADRAGYERARDDARAAIDAAGDRALAGELDLLEGAVAVGEARLDDAETFARSAREHALAAVAPTTYVGASVALSELADIRGDHVAAYEALAVACATLGDLVGRDGADAVFEPRFQALREQWGVGEFDQARAAYEDRRRTELGGPQPR